MRWETVPLGTIAQVEMGQAPAGDSYNDRSEGVGLIAGPGDFRASKITVKKYTTQPTKLSQPGDLIIGIRASIGDLVVADDVYCLGRGVAAVRPIPSYIDDGYLRQALMFLKDDLTAKGRGATFLTVSKADIRSLGVPLPPLPEQRRIAAILDETDALQSTAKRVTMASASLAQSAFRELELTLSDTHVVPLSEIARVGSGITKGRKAPSAGLVEVPYMTVANVQDKRLDLSNVKTIDASEAEIERYRLLATDLLLTEGGDPDKLGRGVVWNSELPVSIHQNHVFRVRAIDASVDMTWLSWEIGSDYGKRYFLCAAKQTTGIATINSSQLRGFPVRIPSKAAVATFRERLDRAEALKATSARRIDAFATLFASLQHRAFRGKL